MKKHSLRLGEVSAQRSRFLMRHAVIAAIFSAAPLAQPLFADATWLASPTDGSWITTGAETNWSTGAATFPGSTTGNSDPDIATFNATSSITSITITNSLTLGGILFDTASASAYTINRTGGTLRMSDGGSISETSTVVNPEMITASMTLNATSSGATTNSYTFNNDSTTSTAVLAFSGAINTGSGAANLVTTLNLSGANTGNNLINNVISDQGTAKPLNLVKSGTGTWILAGNNTYNGTTTINGGILQVGNVGTASTAGTLGVGAISDNGTLVFNRSNNFTVASAISGNGSVQQTGLGTLTLSGNNSYGGTTTVSGGAIQIGSAAALGSSGLAFSSTNGGFLDLNGFDTSVSSLNGNFLALVGDSNSVGGTTTLTVNGSGTSTYSGVISDGFTRFVALAVTGNATVALTGLNSYTGGTLIDTGGLIQINSTTSLGSDGGILTINSGTLEVTTAAGVISEARGFQLGAANSTIQTDSGVTFTISGTVNDTFVPGTLNKTGAGTLILSGTNFYSGGTTITAGTVQLQNSAGLGAGTGPLTISTGTALDLHDNSVTVGALSGTGGVITSTVAGALSLTFGDSSITTFNGILQNGSGTLSVVKQGTGSTKLSATNTYTGTTTILAGTIVATSSTSIGSVSGGLVTIASGGTLDMSGDTTANNVNFGTREFLIAGAGADGVTGAIINNSGVAQDNALENVVLSGNASVGGSSRFDIRGGIATLDLKSFTLTKTGAGQLSIVAGTIKDGGSIVATGGILSLETTTTTTGAGNITYGNGVVAQFFGNSGTGVTWPLTFLGNNFIGNGSGSAAIVPAPIILEGNVTLVPLNSGIPAPTLANQLNLNGNITESGGSFALTKTGINEVILAGTNTYSGGTNVQQGTLFLNSSGALPASTNLTLGNGTNAGTVDLNGHAITLSGLNMSGTTAANLIGSSNVGVPASITYSGGSSTFAGTIGDIGSGNQTLSLTVNSGFLALSGINTYSSNTLNGGTLSVSADANLGASTAPINFNGGTLQVTGTTFSATPRSIIWNANGGGLDISDANNTFTVSVPLSGGALTKLGAGKLRLTGNYTVTNGASTTVSLGSLQLSGTSNAAAAIAGAGNLSVSTGASLVSDGIQLSALSIGGAVQIRSNGTVSGTSEVGALAFSGGSLDLTNNKLIVEDSATHGASLISTRAAVSGESILSSTLAANQTVVVADNALLGLTNFGGIGNVDAGSILVEATFKGDVNLDGQVNISDLNIIAAHWQQNVADYVLGDLNGDGVVNIADLNIVAADWQAGAGSGSSSMPALAALLTTQSVPEPGSLSLLAFGAFALARRRRTSQ